MKSFKFSEQEVELLIAMYEDELKEVTDYTDRLKETLNKLRNETVIEKAAPIVGGKKRGRKPKAAVQPAVAKVAKPGKKRGRKPKVQVVAKSEKAIAPKPVAAKPAKKKKVSKPKARKVVAKKPAAKAKGMETPVNIVPVV